MSNGPEWNERKALFWLVAAVILSHVLIVFYAGIVCTMHFGSIIASGQLECSKDGRLVELLNSALSSALAFAAGRMSGSK